MFLFLVFALIFVPVCNANTAKLKLIRKIPHSGYSEGLDFHEGFLWNALPKEIKKIDPSDGTVVKTFKPATEYSESITWFKGVLWNLSFSDNSIQSGELQRDGFKYTKKGTTPEVHGWGMTHNGKELIITGDYSKKLYFLDPKTLKVSKTLETPEKDLEDLAWDGKHLWTSSFTVKPGTLFRVDPSNGKTTGYFEIPEKDQCPIVDGIAFDGKGLWVTGKECPSIYYFELPK